MTRLMPALAATRSGKPLADKIAVEFTTHMVERYDELGRTRKRTHKEEAEYERIGQIFANNEDLFADPEGALHTRHAVLEDFSDSETHVVLSDYRHGDDKSDIVANTFRGNDAWVVSGHYEAPQSLDVVIEDIRRKHPNIDQHSRAFDKKIYEAGRKQRSVNDNVMEAMILLRTIGICGAGSLSWISPLHPYSRQDRSKEREASMAKLMQEFSQVCRSTYAIFVELHSDQTKSMYQNQFQRSDNLHPSGLFIPRIKQLTGLDKDPSLRKKYCVVAPDAGAVNRNKHYANRLGLPLVVVYKSRDYDNINTIKDDEHLIVVGDPSGRIALVVDDMFDTVGTAKKTGETLIAPPYNAAGYALIGAHGILSGPGEERLEEMHDSGALQFALFTDSVHRSDRWLSEHPYVHQVSVSPPLGHAMYQGNMNFSIGDVYDKERKPDVVIFT